MTPRKTAPRAALYLRQSLDRDGRAEGIERQQERCERLADDRGWDVVEIYVDNDVSASKPRGSGTAWDRLIADVKSSRVEVVVAVDQDRLLRGLTDLVTLIELGARVATVDGELDLTTADGEFRATMAVGLARFEVRRKGERQKRANTARRSKGTPTPGRTPYGYIWIPRVEREGGSDGPAYALDPERADDVKAIYDAFLGGVPLGSIARDLNEAGKRTLPYKRKIGGERVEQPGAPFTPPTLRRMLLSPYYAARVPIPPEGGWPNGRYDQSLVTLEQTVEGTWPPIVTVAQWEAARAMLHNPERTTSPGPTRRWLLSGLAICGGHGKRDDTAIEERMPEHLEAALKVVTEANNARPAEQRADTEELQARAVGRARAEAAVKLAEERCGLPIRAGGGEKNIHSYRCGSMAHFMRRGDPLDASIERLVIKRLSADDAGELLVDRERPDAEALNAQIKTWEAALRALAEERDDGDIGRPEYLRRRKRLDAKLAEARGKLEKGAVVQPLRDLVGAAQAARQTEQQESAARVAEAVQATWDGLSLGRKRAVIEALMTIVVYSVGQGNRRNMTEAAMAATLTIHWNE